jgi:hypothetical protein
VARLKNDVLAVAEDAAVADDRMADLLEELTSAVAASAAQREALVAEARDLGRRIADVEGALATFNADLGGRPTDVRDEPG